MTHRSPATLLAQRFPAKRAFITGAASGLGLAFAQLLAADGWQLGLLDVDRVALDDAATRLRAAGAASTVNFAGDVADEAFVSDSIEAFAATQQGLDLLINNAGVAVAGAVEATPPADWQWIVGINLLGVVWGCRAALPVLKRQGKGLILNVASAAGFAASPRMAPYNATKAGVISLSETLASELAGTGVQVSCAMPGFFRTRLLDQMRAPEEENRMAHRIMEGSSHTADTAALALLGGAAAGELYLVWPPEYRWAWRIKRWFPLWFLKRMQSLRGAQARQAGRPQG